MQAPKDCTMSHQAGYLNRQESCPAVLSLDSAVTVSSSDSHVLPFTGSSRIFQSVSGIAAPSNPGYGKTFSSPRYPFVVMTAGIHQPQTQERQLRSALIKKMHLDLSALEDYSSEEYEDEEDNDEEEKILARNRILMGKAVRRHLRVRLSRARLKIVIATVLFLFLVAVALLIVCVVAANEM